MSRPDLAAALAEAAPLPAEAGEPVFAEPWQAQAFALVVALHDRGLFTWSEWAAALAEEIRAHGGADDGSRYYEFWLHALEDILVARTGAAHAEVDAMAAAWARAAEATPHGEPIRLENGETAAFALPAFARPATP